VGEAVLESGAGSVKKGVPISNRNLHIAGRLNRSSASPQAGQIFNLILDATFWMLGL
jgi:hypothetical protein